MKMPLNNPVELPSLEELADELKVHQKNNILQRIPCFS